KSKKISLATVEKATKIKKEYLAAFEKGDYKLLPEAVYIRGFLRTLANYYHLDSVKLIGKYRQETTMPKLVDIQNQEVNFRTNRLKEPIVIVTPRLISIVLGVVVGLFLIGYLWYEVSGFAVAPKLQITKPGQEEVQITSDLIKIKGQTDNSASLTINQEAIPVNQQGKFTQQVRLQSGFNILEIKAINRSGRETIKELKIIVKKKTQVNYIK
ncbi:unnamed protein product, partial [marine sediment metagenome]